MTSTAAERRVEVRPHGSERPRYGLLAELALGLLPAELDQSIFATALPAVVAESLRGSSRASAGAGCRC